MNKKIIFITIILIVLTSAVSGAVIALNKKDASATKVDVRKSSREELIEDRKLIMDALDDLIEKNEDEEKIKIFQSIVDNLESEIENFEGTELTDVQKDRIAKIEDKLTDAWEDIKSTHNININNYEVCSLKDMKYVLNGDMENIFDKEYAFEVSLKVMKLLAAAPKGSTRPVILFNYNKKEIIVAYKTKEGNNILKILTKDDNGLWTVTEKSKQGSLIKSID